VRRFVALSLVVSAVIGCAPYPEGRRIRSVDFGEFVAYRPLTRDDFRSEVATGFTVPDEEKIQAAICLDVLVRPNDVVTRAGNGGYVATLDEPIFFAVMSRTCSFWSPDESLPDEHVLEHEQIHFAIAELQARRLNVGASDFVRQIYTEGAELGSVSQRAQGELRAILDAAKKAASDRSRVFDLEVRRDRVRQRAWLHKLTADLEATQAYARGPQTAALSAIALEPAPAPPPAVAPAALPPVATPAAPPKDTAPVAPLLPAPSAAPPATVAPAPTVVPARPPTSTGAFPD
jgi:hypothetical protein